MKELGTKPNRRIANMLVHSALLANQPSVAQGLHAEFLANGAAPASTFITWPA